MKILGSDKAVPVLVQHVKRAAELIFHGACGSEHRRAARPRAAPIFVDGDKLIEVHVSVLIHVCLAEHGGYHLVVRLLAQRLEHAREVNGGDPAIVVKVKQVKHLHHLAHSGGG